MKKILVLGCSHSQGSHIFKKLPHPIPEWQAPDVIDSVRGWWYYVDHFKDKNVTVICSPSEGYWTWYQILLFLKQENELNYDEIWIQETDEPRAVINDQKILNKILSKDYNEQQNGSGNYNVVSDNITLFCTDYRKDLILTPWMAGKVNEQYAFWYDNFFKDISMMSAEKIDILCTDNKIKGYVWSMRQPQMKNNHFKRLPLSNMWQELWERNLLTAKTHGGCHSTEEGNKYIANLINSCDL